MESRAVAFVRDSELLEKISAELDERYGIALEVASTAAHASECLAQQHVPTLIYDARVSEFDAEAESLIYLLTTEFEAVNLIVVSDGVYPLKIAAELHLLEGAHVQVRQGLELNIPGPLVEPLLLGSRARPVPVLRQISAGGVSVSSYTPEMAPMLNDLLRVAHRDVTLLFVGETGTGKTTLARFIHNRSPRREKPLQQLACGALPTDLVESELFGHIRGAFTGADRNTVGRFQAAGTGTLLLDEIDVLDLRQQSKLLKVIETGEYEPVGSTETRVSEARLIVAANVDLEELTACGKFRWDLYYRLNVLEFRLPPLRQRMLDIVPWGVQFLTDACGQHNISIEGVHRDFIDALRRYRWPGNLRELKNQMRRSVLFCEGLVLGVNDLAPKIVQAQFADGDFDPNGSGASWTLADRVALNERELLEQALKENDDNRTKTAKALGLSRNGLYKKLRRLGLMNRIQQSSEE